MVKFETYQIQMGYDIWLHVLYALTLDALKKNDILTLKFIIRGRITDSNKLLLGFTECSKAIVTRLQLTCS
jgi:hypothetical protein